jgi:hypothetical protein
MDGKDAKVARRRNGSARQTGSQRSNDSIDLGTIVRGEFIELDAHAGGGRFIAAPHAHDSSKRLKDLPAAWQVKLHRHFGARLVGLLGFDENAAFIDISRELREYLVDGRVIDSHGDAGTIRTTAVRGIFVCIDSVIERTQADL